jgi:hypothetical protein
MAPGPLTNAHRGGFGFNHRGGNAFYSDRRFAGYTTPGRTYPGTRERFSVTPNADTGGHDVALGDNEVAVVAIGDDGSIKIEISNKPPAQEPANGEVTDAKAGRSVHRSAPKQVNRMSWEKNPDGTITFSPDDNETLDVNGDAIQAVVTALPSV